MTCPLYRNYTRHCITKFPDIVTFSNYDFCSSDKYTTCIMYEVIESDFNCKYLTNCFTSFLNNVPGFTKRIFSEDGTNKIVREMNSNYCLSEGNCKNCERYKKLDIGEKPTLGLFPDGESHLLDILLNEVFLKEK